MATISLGVVTRDATAAGALSRNSARMARIFEVLRGAGIAEADMQTTRFDLAPVWQDAREGGGDPARIEAYRVTNALAVIVRDIDALGEVLDAVAEAGLTMEVRIEPDGTIRLLPSAPNPPHPDPREPEAW